MPGEFGCDSGEGIGGCLCLHDYIKHSDEKREDNDTHEDKVSGREAYSHVDNFSIRRVKRADLAAEYEAGIVWMLERGTSG